MSQCLDQLRALRLSLTEVKLEQAEGLKSILAKVRPLAAASGGQLSSRPPVSPLPPSGMSAAPAVCLGNEALARSASKAFPVAFWLAAGCVLAALCTSRRVRS